MDIRITGPTSSSLLLYRNPFYKSRSSRFPSSSYRLEKSPSVIARIASYGSGIALHRLWSDCTSPSCVLRVWDRVAQARCRIAHIRAASSASGIAMHTAELRCSGRGHRCTRSSSVAHAQVPLHTAGTRRAGKSYVAHNKNNFRDAITIDKPFI